MLAVPMVPGKHPLKRTRAPGSPAAERRSTTAATATTTASGSGDGSAREPPKGGVAVLPACPPGAKPRGTGRPAPASAGPVRRATVSKPQPQPPGAGTPTQTRRLSQQLSRPVLAPDAPKPLPPKPLPVPRPKPAVSAPEAAPVPEATATAPVSEEDESVSKELDALASFLASSPPQTAQGPLGGDGSGSSASTGADTVPQGASATADMLKALTPGQDTDAQLADFNMALQSIDDVLGNLQTLTFD